MRYGRLVGSSRRYPARARTSLLAALLTAALAGGCGRSREASRSPGPAPPESAARRRAGARESLAVARRETLAAESSAAGDTAATRRRTTLRVVPAARDSALARLAAPAVRYRTVPIPGPRALDSLARALGERGFANVLRVNRIDLDHARAGLPLVVPDPADSLPLLCPFPARVSGPIPSGRIVFVAQRIQAFAAYDSSRLVRWGPVSTGRRDKPTPDGFFHANWKAKQRVSTIDDSWLLKWAVNFDSRAGISLHEYELPGRPASHSCVRLMPDDAEWLYGWAQQWKVAADGRTVLEYGTPIVIFGAYDFDAIRPWKRLPRDPHATDVPEPELATAFLGQAPRTATASDSTRAAPARDSTRSVRDSTRSVRDSTRSARHR